MSTRTMTLTAMLTALLCICGPLTLPLGAVPLSLTSGLLMLMALLLGPGRATVCCGVYLAIGLAGLPVFGGFSGGMSILAGPTGGFLPGYLLLTAVSGLGCARTENRLLQGLALTGGTLLLYAAGTTGYMYHTGSGFAAALAVCAAPFMAGDAVKIGAVLAGGNGLRRRLRSAGLTG